MRKCDLDGCDRKHLAKGLCRLHYLRKYRTGNTGTIKSKWEITAVERINKKIKIAGDGCWLYTGKLTYKGYAHVRDDNGKMRFAHRIMYITKHGPVPAGLELDHTCRKRHCCNPDHLEAVTHEENVKRGRAGHNRIPGSSKFVTLAIKEKGIL